MKMKKTNIEKFIICVIVAIVLCIALSVAYVTNRIVEEGGIKAVIVEAGKGIKDIGREIAEH